MNVLAVIQARMRSSRLPGKVMLPLAGEHVLVHDVRRASAAETVDQVVVATSSDPQDDVVENVLRRHDTAFFRGSESDVLGRVYDTAEHFDADVVVRITADCPLIDPATIDAVVEAASDGDVDYATNVLERTFPRGFDVEAFSFESFERVEGLANESHHREHVTPYYREHSSEFDLENVRSSTVFEEQFMQNRSNLRLTLDEADDYELLRTIYEEIDFDDVIDVRDAVRYVDENDLTEINEHVDQKLVDDGSDNSS